MNDLGIDANLLQTRQGIWTAREIAQQPAMLRETHALLVAQSAELAAFLAPFDNAHARIILTGAGTSAFIGECLAPYLARRMTARVEAIATTDIVSAPHLYLDSDVQTLLVSFARSGNSPESVAAVDLANRIVTDVRHLLITCNADGALAANARADDYIIQLPDQTHDRGFAMTSSFSCMMYAALAALSGTPSMESRIEPIANAVAAMLKTSIAPIEALVSGGFDRVVYLGSHMFKGLAREAALKLMELSDGQIIATSESPLGFRHGPKTIVTATTLIVAFLSNDPQTRPYEADLLAELRSDGRAGRVMAISAQPTAGADVLLVPDLADAQDQDLLFPFIVAPQIFALHMSLALGLTPDNPDVTGMVNRVVRGVSIHPLVAA